MQVEMRPGTPGEPSTLVVSLHDALMEVKLPRRLTLVSYKTDTELSVMIESAETGTVEFGDPDDGNWVSSTYALELDNYQELDLAITDDDVSIIEHESDGGFSSAELSDLKASGVAVTSSETYLGSKLLGGYISHVKSRKAGESVGIFDDFHDFELAYIMQRVSSNTIRAMAVKHHDLNAELDTIAEEHSNHDIPLCIEKVLFSLSNSSCVRLGDLCERALDALTCTDES